MGQHDGRDLFAFDPMGPEKAGRDAKAAFEAQELGRAVELYAAAVGRLHDLYVLGGFRTRTPTATDAAVLDGLVAAVEALRTREPEADVRDHCRQAAADVEEIARVAHRAGLDGDRFARAAAQLRTASA